MADERKETKAGLKKKKKKKRKGKRKKKEKVVHIMEAPIRECGKMRVLVMREASNDNDDDTMTPTLSYR